jgi:uncharacterized protein
VIAASPVAGKYETARDRESAYEILKARAAQAAAEAEAAEAEKAEEELRVREYQRAERYTGTRTGGARTATRTTAARSRQPETLGGALSQAIVKELSGTTGKRLVRGILGGLFRGR